MFEYLVAGSTLKGILVGVFLCALAMFSGVFCVNMYSISIFNETGTYVNPTISAIIIALIQVVGTFVATILVDYWGRRKLLSSSCLGSAVSLISFATFAYLHQRNFVLTSFYWVPVTSMAMFLLSSNAGILPLTFIIIAESLPQKVIVLFQFFRLLIRTSYRLVVLAQLYVRFLLVSLPLQI